MKIIYRCNFMKSRIEIIIAITKTKIDSST